MWGEKKKEGKGSIIEKRPIRGVSFKIWVCSAAGKHRTVAGGLHWGVQRSEGTSLPSAKPVGTGETGGRGKGGREG